MKKVLFNIDVEVDDWIAEGDVFDEMVDAVHKAFDECNVEMVDTVNGSN